MVGYNDGGIPDSRYELKKELTLREAARRTTLPSPQRFFEYINPVGFIFKEQEILCMTCGKQFKSPTTEKSVIYRCHARVTYGGHPQVPSSETYVLKIVGKEIFVPNRVVFDTHGIEEGVVPLPETEESNADFLARMKGLAPSIVISQQSAGTMPGTSGPPAPTLRPSASSLKKPKLTSSSNIRDTATFNPKRKTHTAGQPHPEALENQQALKKEKSKKSENGKKKREKTTKATVPDTEYITISDDEVRVVAVVKPPPVPDAAKEFARRIADEQFGELEMDVDEPPRRRDQTTSDNSDIELIEIVPRGTQAAAPGPVFDPPIIEAEPLAMDDQDEESDEEINPQIVLRASTALKRAASPVAAIAAKRFSKDDTPDETSGAQNSSPAEERRSDSDAHPLASAPHPEAEAASEIKKNPADSEREIYDFIFDGEPEETEAQSSKQNEVAPNILLVEDKSVRGVERCAVERQEMEIGNEPEKDQGMAERDQNHIDSNEASRNIDGPRRRDQNESENSDIEIIEGPDVDIPSNFYNRVEDPEAKSLAPEAPSAPEPDENYDADLENFVEAEEPEAQKDSGVSKSETSHADETTAAAQDAQFDVEMADESLEMDSISPEPEVIDVLSREPSPTVIIPILESNGHQEDVLDVDMEDEEDNSLEDEESQKPSRNASQEKEMQDEEDPLLPATEADDVSGEEYDEENLEDADSDQPGKNSESKSNKLCDSESLTSSGPVDENILEKISENPEEESDEDMDDDHQEASLLPSPIGSQEKEKEDEEDPLFPATGGDDISINNGEESDEDVEEDIEDEEKLEDADLDQPGKNSESDSNKLCDSENLMSPEPVDEKISEKISENQGDESDEDMDDNHSEVEASLEDEDESPDLGSGEPQYQDHNVESKNFSENPEKESDSLDAPVAEEADVEMEDDENQEEEDDVTATEHPLVVETDDVIVQKFPESPTTCAPLLHSLLLDQPLNHLEASLKDENESPDFNSAEQQYQDHDMKSDEISENPNEESGKDMDDEHSLDAPVSEEPLVKMGDDEDPEEEEDVTATEQPLVVETDDLIIQKSPESPTTCSPLLHSLLLDQSPERRIMSADPNLDEEQESGNEELQDGDARAHESVSGDVPMDVDDSKKVEPEQEAQGAAPKEDKMEVDVPQEEKADKIVEEKKDAKQPVEEEPPVRTRPRRGARPITIQIDRGTSIPTGVTRKAFHFEVNVKAIYDKLYRGKRLVDIMVGPEHQAELPEMQNSGHSSDEESREEEVYWEPVEEQAGKMVDENDMAVYQRAVLLTFNGHIPIEKALGHLRKCGFDFGEALESIDQCLQDLPQVMKPICYGQAKNLVPFLMVKDGKWRKEIQDKAMRNYHLGEIQNFMCRTMIPKYVNRHLVILPSGEDKWLPRGQHPCTCNFFTHEDIVHEPRISCTNCTKMFRNVEGLPEKLCLVCQVYQGFKNRRRPAENVLFNDLDLVYLKKWDTYEKSNNHRISKADFDKLLLKQDTARWQRMELTQEEKDMVDWTTKKMEGWNERLKDAKKIKYGEEVAAQLQPFVIPFLSRCRCKESGSIPRHSEHWDKRTFDEEEKKLFRDAILKHDGDQIAAAEELEVEAELVERFAELFPSGSDLYENKTFELRHRPILPHVDLPPPPPIPIVFKEEKQRKKAKKEVEEDDAVEKEDDDVMEVKEDDAVVEAEEDDDEGEENDSEYDPNENKKISQEKAKKKRAAAAAKAAPKKKPTAPKKPPASAPKKPPTAPRKPPAERQPPQEPQVSARELRARARQ